jgi:LytS/YehU family sensor histidine kinase
MKPKSNIDKVGTTGFHYCIILSLLFSIICIRGTYTGIREVLNYLWIDNVDIWQWLVVSVVGFTFLSNVGILCL